MGPFPAQDSSCTYEDTTDRPGTLECNKNEDKSEDKSPPEDMKCQVISSSDAIVECLKGHLTFTSLVICRW
jgi:hypothetical protein